MRIVALTQNPEESPTRYRVLQYRPFLEAEGCELQLIDWPRRRRRQQAILGSLSDEDVVVMQRRLPSLRIIRDLRSRAGRLIFDFDDAVIFSDSARGNPRLLLDRWLRFRKLVSCCDAITAGNTYLADLASRHVDGNRVVVAPTTIDLRRYERPPAPVNGRLLGWIGCRSTLPYLYSLRDVLRRLANVYPGLTLRVICDRPADLPEIKTEWKPWRPDTEADDLSQVNVGLAPLPEDRWTRGKCGLRLLQYLASRVPSVASPVGTQRKIIQSDGALQASTDEQWYDAIRLLLDDPSAAQACSMRGWMAVQQFDVNHWAPIVKEIWCGTRESGTAKARKREKRITWLAKRT